MDICYKTFDFSVEGELNIDSSFELLTSLDFLKAEVCCDWFNVSPWRFELVATIQQLCSCGGNLLESVCIEEMLVALLQGWEIHTIDHLPFLFPYLDLVMLG